MSSSATNNDAISLFNQSDTVIPSYFEMQATINAVKPIGGVKANAFLIFDFQNENDFKFAGLDVSTNKLVIGHRVSGGWSYDAWSNYQLKAGNDYVVLLGVNDTTATITLGTTSLSYTFAPRVDNIGLRHGMNDGLVGVGAYTASAQIDNIVVQAPPGMITRDIKVDFTANSPESLLFGTPLSGTWRVDSSGRFVGNTTTSTTAIDFITIGQLPITAGSLLNITTTFRTGGRGGIVFDYQGPGAYKYAVLSVDVGKLLLGHVQNGFDIVDASYAVSKLSANSDSTLSVILRAGVVNVALNGSVVVSKVYNEPTTAGLFGLIGYKGATSGQTSFLNVEAKTDEGAYAVLSPLTAASAPTQPTNGPAVSPADVRIALKAAEQRWQASGLLDDRMLAALGTIQFEVADLPGLMLGQTVADTILIDPTAAGFGWFIDTTPLRDEEFTVRSVDEMRLALDASPATGRMDLLTVVMHELGHVLGLEDLDEAEHPGALMDGTLEPGIRRLPTGLASPPEIASPVQLAVPVQDVSRGLGVAHRRPDLGDW